MEPSKKRPEMEEALKKMFGKDRAETIRNNTCMFCEGPAVEFKDELSEREYTISGLCQKCQNEIFG